MKPDNTIREEWKQFKESENFEHVSVEQWWINQRNQDIQSIIEHGKGMKKVPEIVLTRRNNEDSVGTYLNMGYNAGVEDFIQFLNTKS